MVQIPGVYIEFKGDLTQLNKDMKAARQMVTEQAKGMSDSLNNALSGQQVKNSTNRLIESLGTLSRSSVVTGQAFKNLGVDLGQLQKLTGTSAAQFQKLQEQILKTQAASGQEKALRNIATAAGLSTKEIAALGNQFGLTKAQIENVTRATNDLGKSTDFSYKKFKDMIVTVGIYSAAFAAVNAAMSGAAAAVRIADQYTLLDSKLKLVSKSTEEFGTTYKTLFDISQRTGSSFTTNAAAFSSLQLNMRDMNVSSAETLKMFEMLNKSLVVNGSNTVEASTFMLQFKQAMGSGKLAGDELRTTLEANSYFGTLLAKSLGVTTGALKDMGAEGKLTTDVLLRAFPQMSAQVDKDFGAIQKTISRAMVELRNAFEDVIADSNRTTGATSSVAESISELAKTVTENKESISSLFQGLIYAGGFAIGMIADVTRSIQGLAIVAASPSKSLGDWVMSNAEDMKKWQEEVSNGTAFINDRLFELAERRNELAITAGDAFNSEKIVSAAEKEIAAIDRETAVLQGQILAFEGLAKAKGIAKDSFIVANSGAQLSTPNANFRDPFQANREWDLANAGKVDEIVFKRQEEARKKREQVAQDQLAIEQKVTDGIMQATKSRYDYSVWALDQEVAKMREKAGTDKELQSQITEYRKQQLAQLGDFSKMYDSDEGKRLDEMRDAFTTVDKDLATIAANRADRQQDALEKMTGAIKSSKQSEIEAYKDAVDAELAELERLSDGSVEYEEKLAAYKEIKRRELNERLLREEKRNLTEMQKLWQNFAEDTKRDFTDIFAAGLKGEFDTIGEAWKSLLDTMADRFLDLIAQLTMNSLFDAIGLGQISGGGATWGDALGWVVGAFTGGSGTAPDYAQGWEVPAYSSAGSGGGGGSSAGGVVGGLATTVVTGYIKDQIMTNVIKPIGTAIMDNASSMFAQEAASTVASEAAAAAASEAAASAATQAASEAAAEAATESIVGEGLGSALGDIGMIATAMWTLANSDKWSGRPDLPYQMTIDQVGMNDISQVAGIQQTGEFVSITREMGEALGLLNNDLGSLSLLSLDSANNLAILGGQITDAETGMKGLAGFQMYTIDEVSGAWTKTGGIFMEMVAKMQELDPATEDAIQATAEYVAQMYGFPTAADELVTAFGAMSGGIYDLAEAGAAAAGTISAAAAEAAAAANAYSSINWSTDARDNGGDMSSADVGSSYAVPTYYDEPRGHADGGIHAGGWRIVGERGPELEYTPPSRIYSNTDTNSILNEMRKGGGSDIGPVTVQIIGKGPGLEALIDQVIVTRGRQNVPATSRVFV